MPSDYTAPDLGGNAGLISSTVTIEEPSDGDKIKAASVNPAFEGLTNIAGAYIKYGIKSDGNAQVINGSLTINGDTFLYGRLAERTPHYISSAGSSQTFSAATAKHFIVTASTTFASPGTWTLSTAGVSDGEQMWFHFQDISAVGGGAGGQHFKSGASPNDIVIVQNDRYFTEGFTGPITCDIGFHFLHSTGAWRLLSGSPYLALGAGV